MTTSVTTRPSAAIRLLNGASPGSIRIPPQPPGQPIFDWRELKRWGIPESRLPSGSVVRYRSPSVWREYRGTILITAGALVIQALLIIGLLFERRARHRAEIDSRRSLALAADAGRRETMSALTHSILHELIQPLTSMMHNTQALEMMITAKRATPDTIGEVLSDIQSEGVRATQIIERYRTMLRSRQLQKKPIDLHAVVRECLALVAHDVAARQIAVNLNLCSKPCVISGDQVLLQQVFLNLVINAMDAMAEMPPPLRQVTITSEVMAADAAVSVRDMGPGLPADIMGSLFHTIRHHEIAWPWDRPHDRAVDRQRSRRHHQGLQQSRRGRDIHDHAARHHGIGRLGRCGRGART